MKVPLRGSDVRRRYSLRYTSRAHRMKVPLRGSDVRRKFIRDEFRWRVVREHRSRDFREKRDMTDRRGNNRGRH